MSNNRPNIQRGGSPLFKGARENVKAIQDLLFERWTNGACLGYVIQAMENIGFSPKDVQLVTTEMNELFDVVSNDEAEKHYCNSHY